MHHACLKLPSSDIPTGEWSIAFAPGVLKHEGWVLVFGALGSEFVWVFWPAERRAEGEPAGYGEEEFVQYLRGLVSNKTLKVQEDMKAGDARHKALYAIVQQGVWADGERVFLGADWRCGEFGGVY